MKKLIRVVTFPELNNKFSVNLQYGFFDHDYMNFLNIEVLGDELYGNFNIKVDIYDNENNFKSTIGSLNINGQTFDGITAKKFPINKRLIDDAHDSHIRIYPTNSYIEDPMYESMTLVQVGLNVGERRKYIDKLSVGETVYLSPDPNNEFDRFAVKVLDANENHIGFLKSDCAYIYNQFIDDYENKPATILKINKSSIYLKSPILFSTKNEFLFGG